jgi:TRAP-type C4-dicarboxylate transport system substrate-binding protein
MSKMTWDKLSSDDQNIIKESAVEAAKYMTAQAREKEADFIKKIEEAGVEVNDVDKPLFVEKTTSAYDWFESEYDISIANEIKAMK